jgi:hypothetical protein
LSPEQLPQKLFPWIPRPKVDDNDPELQQLTRQRLQMMDPRIAPDNEAERMRLAKQEAKATLEKKRAADATLQTTIASLKTLTTEKMDKMNKEIEAANLSVKEAYGRRARERHKIQLDILQQFVQEVWHPYGDLNDSMMAICKWMDDFLQENKNMSLPVECPFANLSSFGNLMARINLAQEAYNGVHMLHAEAAKCSLAQLHVYFRQRGQLNVVLLGIYATGKSYVCETTKAMNIPGTCSSFSAKSDKSYFAHGSKDINDKVMMFSVLFFKFDFFLCKIQLTCVLPFIISFVSRLNFIFTVCQHSFFTASENHFVCVSRLNSMKKSRLRFSESIHEMEQRVME